MRKLYLDDKRDPKTEGWEIVRNYTDFVKWIELNGVDDLLISFDHDLADEHYAYPDSTFLNFGEYSNRDDKEYTGYECAKWLCNYCLTHNYRIPNWNVHSANPIGAEYIDSIMKNYTKKLNSQ